MPRYQTASQRAAGPTSASPAAPKGAVRPAGSKSRQRSERPTASRVASPAAHTTTRETQAARHAAERAAGAAIGSRSMTGIFPFAAFLDDYDAEVTAAVSILVALLLAALVDRAFARAARLARERGPLDVSPVAATRVRFARRLAVATIVLIGVMAALAQCGTLSRVATSVLASGALAAAVIGFAARQVLANAVAGVMLAITQPLRIGDHVEFEGESGTVEDVRLNYTYLRSGAGTRVVIPNQRLAAGVPHNDTIVPPLSDVQVSAWLRPAGDGGRRA